MKGGWGVKSFLLFPPFFMGYLKVEKNNNTYSTPLITDTSRGGPRLLNLNQLNLNNNNEELYAYHTQINPEETETNTNLISSISIYSHYTSAVTSILAENSSTSSSSAGLVLEEDGDNPVSYWGRQPHALITPRSLSIFFNNLEAQYGAQGINYHSPKIYLNYHHQKGASGYSRTTSFQGNSNVISWWDYSQTTLQGYENIYSQMPNDISCPFLKEIKTIKSQIINVNGTNKRRYTSSEYQYSMEKAKIIFFDESKKTVNSTINNTITTWKNSKSRQSQYTTNTTAWSVFTAQQTGIESLALKTTSRTFSGTAVDRSFNYGVVVEGAGFGWLQGIFKMDQTGWDVSESTYLLRGNSSIWTSFYKTLADWVLLKNTKYTSHPTLPPAEIEAVDVLPLGVYMSNLTDYITESNSLAKSKTLTDTANITPANQGNFYNYNTGSVTFNIGMKNHIQASASATLSTNKSISYAEYARFLQSYSVSSTETSTVNKTLENGATTVTVNISRYLYPRISISLSQKVQSSIWSKVRSTGSISGSISYNGSSTFGKIESKYTTTTNTTRSSGYTLTEKSAGGTTLSSGTTKEGGNITLTIPNSTTAAFIVSETANITSNYFLETYWRFLKKALYIKKDNSTSKIWPMHANLGFNTHKLMRGTIKLHIRAASTAQSDYSPIMNFNSSYENQLVFPLTTNTTASEYSPICLRTNRPRNATRDGVYKKLYLATITETTFYHTTTTTVVKENTVPMSVFNNTSVQSSICPNAIANSIISTSLIASSWYTDMSDYLNTYGYGEAHYGHPGVFYGFAHNFEYLFDQSVSFTDITGWRNYSEEEATNTIVIAGQTLKKNMFLSPFLNSLGQQTKVFHNGTIFLSGLDASGGVEPVTASIYNGTQLQTTIIRAHYRPLLLMTFLPRKTLTLACTYSALITNQNF